MRLIDADRMKFVLDKNFGGTSGAAILTHLIDMQPTAYDVEAVVRELEGNAEGFFVRNGEFIKTIPLEIAIGIVKRGEKERQQYLNVKTVKTAHST